MACCFAGRLVGDGLRHQQHRIAAARAADGFAALSPEFKALVNDGQIRSGMTPDAVYIAWGKPAQILQREDQDGVVTVWLYHGGWLEETRYWT